MKIMIRNLARSTTKDQLVRLFQEFGDLNSLNLVLDKETRKSKGFGFAEMPDKKEAQKAIKKLNGMILDGEKIRVKTVATSSSKRRR
jgi:RNA recognition motif-containing protein